MDVVVTSAYESRECRLHARCPQIHGNDQPPILKLPEEILLNIFIMLRNWDWTPRIAVTRITHVCREWRYIAIAAPLLWTLPLCSYHPEWTTMALQRACMAPITVNLDFLHRNDATDISKALLRHISHTLKLDIYGTCDHLNGAQELFPENDAAQLEELDLWCSGFRRHIVGPTRPFVLSSTMFRHTHRLRRLSLNRVDIDFNSPLLRNLTKLDLSHISSEFVPTWTKLFEVLRAMPLLEKLSLHHVFPQSDAPVAISSLEPFWLDSLDSLSIQCNTASQLYIVLEFVLFSPLLNLNLCWDADDLGQDQTIIFQSIADSVYAQHLGSKVGSLLVHQISSLGCIKLWGLTHGSSSFSVCFPESSVDIGHADFVETFIDIFCMSNIIMFNLKVDHEYSHDDLLRLAGRMPLLEYVTVGSLTAFNFVEILDVEPRTPHSESSPQICLPKLESITWAGGDFSGFELWVDGVAVGIFTRRQERGHGLKSLEFEEVENLSPEFVCLFEKVIPKVWVSNFGT